MLTKFRHILVPLDFTAKNQAALEIALELASQNKASVTFLHVIETIENLQDAELTAFYTRLASRAEAELATQRARVCPRGNQRRSQDPLR